MPSLLNEAEFATVVPVANGRTICGLPMAANCQIPATGKFVPLDPTTATLVPFGANATCVKLVPTARLAA